MKQNTIGALFFLIANLNATAQTWFPVGTGTDTTVKSSIVFNNDLFISGNIMDAGGIAVNKVAKWDGAIWSSAGTFTNEANAFGIYNNELFSATDAGSVHTVKKWNGSTWLNLLTSSDGSGHSIATDTVNDIMYVGGNFTTVNGITMNSIMQWNGTTWNSLGSGLGHSSTPLAKAMITIGGDLYVGGTFTTAGGVTVENIAKWDGSSWSALGSGMDGQVNALSVFNGNLYAGGDFTTAGGTYAYGLAKWDGIGWSQVGTGIDGYVNTIAYDPSRNALFVGGTLVNAGSAFSPGIAMWDDVNWSGLGSGVLPLYPLGVTTITCHEGSAYIGGEFYNADSIVVKHIARWGSGTVWPGDANNDLNVDNTDLLEIGLHYSETGSPRTTVNNSWHPYNAVDWGTFQSNGSDVKHIDCNGDGVINDSDTLGINQNFSLSHPASFIASALYRSGPDMYFTTAGTTYNAGQWVDLELWLGTSGVPVTSLYGISFNIDYDATLVEPSSEYVEYPSSWLAASGTNAISFFKADNTSNTVYGSVVRIDHANSSGFGKIANFKFQVNTGLLIPASMNFSISNFLAVDANGDSIDFTPTAHTIAVEPLTTGVLEYTGSNFTVSPNPFNESTVITLSTTRTDAFLEIMDITGKVVQNLPVTGSKIVLEKGMLSKGVYFIRLFQNDRFEIKKLLIQ
ncbi:MAG: T9SS type A sorting domain-containing protein [Bacteroidota bacterium]|nr:T9SS type A sorting domain-containing protein [Bacteroidota bacterium]